MLYTELYSGCSNGLVSESRWVLEQSPAPGGVIMLATERVCDVGKKNCRYCNLEEDIRVHIVLSIAHSRKADDKPKKFLLLT